MAQEIPLDGDLIKVLASDTRRDILGLLKNRRRTVTELAEDLDLRKATVHEHLKKLVEADLIQREEDDRLWVYYQLTPRGKRILNPSRSRIYLVVGLGILAAVVGAVALAVFLMQSPGGAPDTTATEPGVQVALADDETVGAEGVRLEGVVNASDGGQLDAYLVSEEEAKRLDRGEVPDGIRLSTRTGESWDATAADAEGGATAEGDAADAPAEDTVATRSGPVETTFSTDASVPPGTYVLYVRSGADADNRDQLPRVRVVSVDAEVSHDTWWRGVSDPLEVTVRQDGEPATGEVQLAPASGLGPGLDAPVERGRVRFPVEDLDALSPGTYQLRFSPEGADRSSRLDEVRVHDPSIAVTPRRAVAGTPTTLNVSVHGGLDPLDAPVQVRGGAVVDRADEPGRTRLRLAAGEPGAVSVEVGRLAERTVDLVPSMRASVTVEDGPRWRFDLSHPNGSAAGQVAVRLDGRGLGFTSDNGTLVVDDLPEGVHRLAFQTPEGPTVERTVQVDGWQVRPADPRVSVAARQTGSAGGQVTVDVDVNVSGPGRLVGTLNSRLGATPVDATGVDLSNGTASVQVATPVVDERELRFGASVDPLETTSLAFANGTSPAEDTGTTDGNATTGDDAGDEDGDGADANVTADDELAGDEASVQLDIGPIDGDGIPADRDNCPEIANPDQLDADRDGVGDACEAVADRPDADGDGVADLEDACPRELGPAANDGCPAPTEAADGADAAEGQAQETPEPGLAVAITVLAAVALAAGRRRLSRGR